MDLMDSIAEALRADGAESPFSCSCALVAMITCASTMDGSANVVRNCPKLSSKDSLVLAKSGKDTLIS